MEGVDEIVRDFLVESYENLDQLDQDLVALETQPDSRELLSSIFRTIHTIKGTSGFLAFSRLEELTHVGENLLVELRDGRRRMNNRIADVLLTMVDTVRAILAAIEQDGTEGTVEIGEVLAQIRAVQAEQDDDGGVTATAGGSDGDVEPASGPAVARGEDGVAGPAVAAGEDGAAEPAVATGEDDAATTRQARPAGDPPAEDPLPGRTIADTSIRVDVDLLDALMRQVGELVLARNQFARLAEDSTDPELVRTSQRLSLIASELQEGVMRTRMQPIDHIWSKMPRVVRDLAAGCGREVRLVMVGGDTELDRSLLEAVKDPLTHLVRNAIDHGIEPPGERLAAGKPAHGTLTLRAFHAGGQVVVEVSDDGRGIDPQVIGEKAVEKGLRTPAQIAALGPKELLDLLFLPGFSTAQAVTNVSGRGVGMDVVRSNIEAIGGSAAVESVVGLGTTWRLHIPLTLAIMPALTVECAGEQYALPQAGLLELVALDPGENGIEHVGTAPVHRLRGDLLPLVDLREVVQAPPRGHADGAVIAVLQADGHRFGLLVDRVRNSEEIVVKPLSARLKAIGLYAGATLLGDGSVSLILDVQAIAKRSIAVDSGDAAATRTHDAEQEVTGTRTTQVLVAGIGAGRRVAIPLSAVTRLETLPAAAVENVAGREVVQYRGAITPLVRLSHMLGSTSADTPEELLVVVYTRGERSVAIVVEEIIDIVDDDVAHHSDLGGQGLVGSTVLDDRVTELVDIRSAVLMADPRFFDEPTEAHLDDLVGA